MQTKQELLYKYECNKLKLIDEDMNLQDYRKIPSPFGVYYYNEATQRIDYYKEINYIGEPNDNQTSR